MSSMVLERECLICACAFITLAPAILSQVACEVRALQRTRNLLNLPRGRFPGTLEEHGRHAPLRISLGE